MTATSIDVSYLPDRCVVTVVGDVDEPEAGALADVALRCLDAEAPVLLVDLDGVTFLGSAGLNALVRVRRAALDRSASVRLRRVPSRVTRVLTIAGLDTVLPAEDAC